ncbi:hypothetical protein KDL45_08200 [bacterium]|nr:hypothetical protein [bacterium]MCB9478338.1 hypothetical protein [Deltaproteobacteria bacterium]
MFGRSTIVGILIAGLGLALLAVGNTVWAQENPAVSDSSAVPTETPAQSGFTRYAVTEDDTLVGGAPAILMGMSPSPFTWSSYYGFLESEDGTHRVNVFGSMQSYDSMHSVAVGSPTDLFMNAIEYRYTGILGGIIRPVGSVYGGLQRDWTAAGPGFQGYDPTYNGVIGADAGVEIVFPVGRYAIGAGARVGYTWQNDVDRVLGVGEPNYGPYTPKGMDPNGIDEWMTRFYPIVERRR